MSYSDSGGGGGEEALEAQMKKLRLRLEESDRAREELEHEREQMEGRLAESEGFWQDKLREIKEELARMREERDVLRAQAGGGGEAGGAGNDATERIRYLQRELEEERRMRREAEESHRVAQEEGLRLHEEMTWLEDQAAKAKTIEDGLRAELAAATDARKRESLRAEQLLQELEQERAAMDQLQDGGLPSREELMRELGRLKREKTEEEDKAIELVRKNVELRSLVDEYKAQVAEIQQREWAQRMNGGGGSEAAGGGKKGGGGATEKELRKEMERLERELDDVCRELADSREDKEATVTELVQQVVALNDKLALSKREKEAAVAAAERRIEVLRRELAGVVEENEQNKAEIVRGRASVAKAEEYLKALDVARVEVKRLRLERDLITDRLRSLEEQVRAGTAAGGGAGGWWLVPSCLQWTDGQGGGGATGTPHGMNVPDTPSR